MTNPRPLKGRRHCRSHVGCGHVPLGLALLVGAVSPLLCVANGPFPHGRTDAPTPPSAGPREAECATPDAEHCTPHAVCETGREKLACPHACNLCGTNRTTTTVSPTATTVDTTTKPPTASPTRMPTFAPSPSPNTFYHGPTATPSASPSHHDHDHPNTSDCPLHPASCAVAFRDTNGHFLPAYEFAAPTPTSARACSLCSSPCPTGETLSPCTLTSDRVCAPTSKSSQEGCSKSSVTDTLKDGTVVGIALGAAVTCALSGFFIGSFVTRRSYAKSSRLSANFAASSRGLDKSFYADGDDDLLGAL
eukprot:m.117598 g.117598  ORF g.117598 m.117598 type:complete len:306 (+) comp10946_c0_seq3:415-1332(+)